MPTYGLRRGRQWLQPAARTGPALTDDPSAAWTTDSLDTALERQAVLRHCYGLASMVAAIPSPARTARR
jgi:hypothetical protein